MAIPLRVLFVEDSEQDLVMLLTHFGRSEYEVTYTCVETADELADALGREAWDIVVSDYCLPEFSGDEALRLVQHSGIDLPFIIVSGNIGEETAVAAMKAGAHDYIFKGNLQRLLPAVTRELCDAQQRREHRHAQQALAQIEARHRHLVEHIPATIYWTDAEHPLSMQYISPQVVDQLGYGQQSLQQNPALLRQTIHPDDLAYVHRTIVDAVQTNSSYRIEYRLCPSADKTLWVLDTADVVKLEGGSQWLVQGVIINVTHQKMIESSLRQHEAELRTLSAELAVAEERERRRMAVALHDNISQMLAFAKAEVRALLKDASLASSRARVERLHSYIDDAYQETRTLTFELSPPILYDLGLEAAVDWLAEQYSVQHGISIAVSHGDTPVQLEQENAIIVFRAVQELLTNVVKHANASTVTVHLARTESAVQLIVTDDGIGCDVQSQLPSGATESYSFGLFNLRERMSHLGGRFVFTSSRGHGTQVMVELPIALTGVSTAGVSKC